METKRTLDTVRCAVCKKLAPVIRVTVDMGQLGQAIWTKLPAGWWRLEQPLELSLHCRCPGCLKAPK
jgi:hypothetical protein